MEFLTSPAFQTALGSVVLIAVAGIVGYLAKSIKDFIDTKATADQINILQTIAGLAVQAAEQGGIAGTVTDKKKSALNLVNLYLVQLGITGVTAEQIDSAIEAAVYAALDDTEEVDGIE